MFVVFNKEKIYSYLISLGTVMILFVMAIVITNRNERLIQTSTNLIISNNIEKNEYNINNNLINESVNSNKNDKNITKMLQK